MSSKKLYGFYFMYGVLSSITMQMLPLVMIDKGYSNSQVSVILSFVFLAAIFQPLVGYLTKIKFGSKRMLELLVLLLIVTSLVIFAITQYVIMLFVVLLFSIARLSISPIYDSYTTKAVKTDNINYGLVRSGASLGFGLGMAIYTVVANIFNLSYSMAFVAIALVGVVAVTIMSTLPHEQVESSSNLQVESETNIPKSIILISIYVFFLGALNVRGSYMSMYYVEFGYTTSFISLATFFLVIPEVIFLPLYNRLFARFDKVVLLIASVLIAIFQLILYILFTGNPFILLFACLFNGFQVMLFFPTYFGLLQASLGIKNSSFGFVINMTMQSLFVGFFNLLLIRPVIVTYNSTIPIFILIIGMELMAFIPIAIYHFKYNKNKC